MQRYFVHQILKPNQVVKLDKDDERHLVKVLRATSGTKIEVVDKNKNVFVATMNNDSDFEINEEITKNVEFPCDVIIACSISKGDKSEQIVKKGTELGANCFIFFESQFSVAHWKNRTAKKIARLQEIAKNAAQQSHRQIIPQVYFQTFDEVLKNKAKYKLVAYEESAKQGEKSNLKSVLEKVHQNPQSIITVFGPEGGLSSDEVSLFEQNNFIIAGLGPRILRAETAPLYLLAALSYELELK